MGGGTRAERPASRSRQEWTRGEVLTYLASRGRTIAPATWSSYVARGQAPGPRRHVSRTPLWDAAEVRVWQKARRGQDWRAGR